MPSDSPEEIQRRAVALAPTLYPELQREDLSTLTRRLVVEAGYALDAVEPGSVRVGDRFSQFNHAALERLFLFDLWSKGVCYGDGATADPRIMADAIGAFVIGRATVDEMGRRFPFVRFKEAARAHEAGRLVDQRWQSRLEASDNLGRILQPLFAACARRPRLRALFPFTSLDTVLFSRTTGFPYDAMNACARPAGDPTQEGRPFIESVLAGRFDVVVRDSDPPQATESPPRYLGTGNAEWAAGTLEREVPAHWGAAVDGTADDADSR